MIINIYNIKLITFSWYSRNTLLFTFRQENRLLSLQLHRIGPKLLFNGGILTTGTCAIFFGLLDKVNGHYPFIILSFVIRIVEAMGNAAFLTASFAIIAKEFPDNVATTFASLETFFGLGLIVGPTVGGILYQVRR